MTDLLDHQFEVDDVVFGAGRPIEVEKWLPNAASWRTQDKAMSRGDGVRVGRDLKGSAVWAFEAFANADDDSPGGAATAALAAVAELGDAWPRDELRNQPTAVTALRYRINGRTRRVYGRPREYDAPIDTMYLQGLIPVTMNFLVTDPLYYEDTEESIEVNLVPETSGGLRSPVRSPVRSVYTSKPQQKAAVVGGKKPTWATVEIEGSCINPWVQVGSLWRVQAMTSMAYDDVVTFDSRPQSRSTTRRGAAVPVSRNTRIAEMLLPPGRHAITFGSDDGGSSATATVRWRNAHGSI